MTGLYASAPPASRTGPIYNTISYPTKISAETVALFIATHTEPGATVLDVFGGSGSTGLGALLCDRPTDKMKQLADQLDLTPTWGPRKAVVYELSVFGAFIAEAMCSPPDPDEFEQVATDLVADADREVGWIYEAADPHEDDGEIRHVIWTDILRCHACSHETTYWDAAVRRDPDLSLNDEFECPGCLQTIKIDDCNRVTETVYDRLLDREIERRQRKPARVYGRTGTTSWQRPARDDDARLADKAASERLPSSTPIQHVFWGDLYRSGYHHGMSHIHHFYTPRNLLALSWLWDRISAAPSHLRPALRLLVLSYNASHSTLMTRVVVKTGQQDFVLTGAQTGVLYVSGLPVEKNVFKGVRRKISTLTKAFRQVADSRSTVEVFNGSSTDLNLADGSVSYVFTDPPFGDYIPYSEINQLNEAWLGSLTDRRNEAIISPAQDKGLDSYERLMTDVFQEVSRVLAPDGLCTVVFHSAKAEVWRSLLSAVTSAGLGVDQTSVLDKVQASFKQTVANTAVKGDPVMLLSKRDGKSVNRSADAHTILQYVIGVAEESDDDAERSRERLFSRFVGECLRRGVPVPHDAGDFYKLIEAYGTEA